MCVVCCAVRTVAWRAACATGRCECATSVGTVTPAGRRQTAATPSPSVSRTTSRTHRAGAVCPAALSPSETHHSTNANCEKTLFYCSVHLSLIRNSFVIMLIYMYFSSWTRFFCTLITFLISVQLDIRKLRSFPNHHHFEN